jgi:hypothetical protein
MKGPDVTVYLDRDYLAKAISFGLHRISTGDSVSPLQFSRGGDLMIVMPVRAIAPDHIERPRLVPAVEQFASQPAPVPKQVAPAAPQPPTPPTPEPTKKVPNKDPLTEARHQVAEADEALLTARRTLKGVRRSLHSARTQRSEIKRELRGFRGLLHKLKRSRRKEGNESKDGKAA